MLIDGNAIDPDTGIDGGIAKDVSGCVYQLLNSPFPRVRDEEGRDSDINRVD